MKVPVEFRVLRESGWSDWILVTGKESFILDIRGVTNVQERRVKE